MALPAVSPPSDSPAANGDASKNSAHSRAYQACEGCRSRKVRCVMGTGDVDHPAGPPCNRCRREQKQCLFSETRRKRTKEDGDMQEDSVDGWDPSYNDPPYSSPSVDPQAGGRNKRVRRSFPVKTSIDGAVDGAIGYDPAYEFDGPGPLTASTRTRGPYATVIPTSYPATAGYNSGGDGYGQTPGAAQAGHIPRLLPSEEEDRSVATLQHHDMYSRDNMMGMLIRAAEQQANDTTDTTDYQQSNQVPLDPQMTSRPSQNATSERLLATWKRLKFVRSGWFKAKEGIAYIDYFYRHMYPLTPVGLPEYNEPEKQVLLLEQERVLLVTILCISSRYMKLEGPAAHTRASKIHDKLWSELYKMLGRLWLAQEQFGGGLCGAGADSEGVTKTGYQGMRTIGTIEALILLTEWNPRALHFPPESDDEDFMLPDGVPIDNDDHDMSTMLLNGTGNERKASWLEPLWRSDRMSWMLLNTAIALAMEIGVFDETTLEKYSENNPTVPRVKLEGFWIRKKYLRELLPVYFIQLAGRLEFINQLPTGYTEALSSKTGAEERIKSLLNEFNGVTSPGLTPGSSPGTSYKDYRDPDQVLMYFWQEIAAILRSGNQELFYNGETSRQLVKDGRYASMIDLFHEPLNRWQKDFEECIADNNYINPRMCHILRIEYECARVHLNSLAIQAVLDRCISNTPPARHASLNGVNGNGKTSSSKSQPIPPSVLRKWCGEDRKYIDQVLEASRKVLRIVVEDLLPGDVLKHIPVRTYSRIISVQVILCKAVFFGAYEAEMNDLFNLADRAMEALINCNVDDVHISNQFAAMCKSVLKRVRTKLIRVTANQPSRQDSPSLSGARTPNPGMLPRSHPISLPGPAIPNPNDMSLDMSHLTPGDFTTSNNNILPFSVDEYNPTLHSVMPPPGVYAADGHFDYTDPNSMDDTSGAFMMDNISSNWITGNFNDLFLHQGADVTGTHFGPALNGMDLLDTLAPPDGGN
ncbi:hypothetical protein BT63DRAFT_426987 [Microthyrium microscopicum]|uniref:Zn(2)-C6 fungal-type domain-containing protein n=1 Tax=Microthyrium microscopicum TaxID=703497 RepID=A0A6A6U5H5_9PEZI|nr:hypothetical protein BT63DRAFT_426987 [Microthyrium microscopicum]